MTAIHCSSTCGLKQNLYLFTNDIALNALVTQPLRSDIYLILGFAISDQHNNLSRIRSHPDLLVVLEGAGQSEACNEDMRVTQLCVQACR